MSRFRQVRSKKELDDLISSVTKDKKKIKGEIDETVLGKEFSKQQSAASQAPVLSGLEGVAKRIEEIFNPAVTEELVTGKPYLGTRSKRTPSGDIERINKIQELLVNNATIAADIKRQNTFNKNAIVAGLNLNNVSLQTLANLTAGSQLTLTQTATAVNTLQQVLNDNFTDVTDALAQMPKELATYTIQALGSSAIIPALEKLKAQVDVVLQNQQPPPPSSGAAPVVTQTQTQPAPDPLSTPPQSPDPNVPQNTPPPLISPAPSTHPQRIIKPPPPQLTQEQVQEKIQELLKQATPELTTTTTTTSPMTPTITSTVTSSSVSNITPNLGDANDVKKAKEKEQEKVSQQAADDSQQAANEKYIINMKITPSEKTDKDISNSIMTGRPIGKKTKQLIENLDPDDPLEEANINAVTITYDEVKEIQNTKNINKIATFIGKINTFFEYAEFKDYDDLRKLGEALGYDMTSLPPYDPMAETFEDNKPLFDMSLKFQDKIIEDLANKAITIDKEGAMKKRNIASFFKNVEPNVNVNTTIIRELVEKIKKMPSEQDKLDFKLNSIGQILGIAPRKRQNPGMSTRGAATDKIEIIKELKEDIKKALNTLISDPKNNQEAIEKIAELEKKSLFPEQSPSKTPKEKSAKKKQQQQQQPLPPPAGQGILGVSIKYPSGYDPYQMTGTGAFGKLKISTKDLDNNHLRVFKDGQQIAYHPIQQDLKDLLTKRFSKLKKYNPESVAVFQKLVKHGEIPVFPKLSKYQTLLKDFYETDILPNMPKQQGNGCECEDDEYESEEEVEVVKPTKKGSRVKLFKNVEEIANRLHILMGEMSAGNTNEEIQDEMSQLIEFLKKGGHIDDENEQLLMKASGLI